MIEIDLWRFGDAGCITGSVGALFPRRGQAVKRIEAQDGWRCCRRTQPSEDTSAAAAVQLGQGD
jgi:hypothetical protein